MATASIYAGYLRPPRSLADYENELIRGEALQENTRAQRQENALKAAAYRDMQESNAALDAAYAQGGDIDAMISRMAGNRRTAGQAAALQKQKDESGKAKAAAGKDSAESEAKVVSLYRDAMAMVNDPQTAAEYVTAMHADPRLAGSAIARVPLDKALAQIGTDPAAFQKWKQEFAVGAAKYVEMNKPVLTEQRLGGTSRMMQTPGLGGAPVVVSEAPITQSADNRASNERQAADAAASRSVQIRGQNLTNERALESNRNTASTGKPPPGYRFKPDGSLEAIPGGPADIKAGELGAKREKSQQAAMAQADRIIATVDSALDKVGYTTAGAGSVVAGVPGTTARDLKSELETVKANLGFAELQAMREAAPTGGALGAIAVQELTALQSTVASLDQGQSPAQLQQSLKKIRGHLQKLKEVNGGSSGGATGSFDAPAGGSPQTATNPQTGEKLQLVNGQWVPMK